MSNRGEPRHDADMRREIEEYADGIIHLLGKNLGVITEAADPTARVLYSDAMLAKHDPSAHANWQSGSPEERPEPTPPIGEQKIFEDWRDKGYADPILIVAPAGSGKSCLLESFALRMANDLHDPGRWPQTEALPPAVPLLVSLKYVGDTSLDDYLPRAGRELSPPFPSLSPETLKQLRSKQRLVLLLDGLDEVPATHAKLLREIKLLPDRYLLTTRPGYGEDRIGDAQWQRRSLDGLTKDRARIYVQAYFELFSCPMCPPAQVMKMWDRAWSTSLGRLLRRPLYLKAWCDFVHDRLQRGAAPPTPDSLADLAHLLLRQSVEFRPAARSQFGDDFESELDGFIRWFGAMGRVFADEGFEELTRIELANRGTFSKAGETERLAQELRWERAALRCGWLAYSKANGAYWMPKVPLVEYQIGKALADDAIQHPESPQVLIEAFRRWLWQPFLHDILDYTFDALWGTDRAEVRDWADVLLEWAARSAKGLEAIGGGPLNPPAQDDLLYPFLISLIRWQRLRRTANLEADKTSLEQAARKTAKALRPAVERRAPIGKLIDRVDLGDDLLFSVQQGLCEQFRLATWESGLRPAWRSAIWSSTNLVREPEPVGRVRDLIEEYRLAAGDSDLQSFWQHAIEGAAGGVRKTEVAQFVRSWMEQYWLAAGDHDAQVAWHLAIRSAAKLASAAVADIMSSLISWHELESDPAWRDAWRHALSYTVERMNEAESVLVGDLIEQYRLAKSGSAAQSVWRSAVSSAVGHVRETEAARLLIGGIEQHRLADGDPDAQNIWRYAIDSGAEHVAKAEAARVVRCFIEEYHSAAEDADAESFWQRAIRSAAERIDEAEAVGVVQELVDQYGMTSADSAARDGWCHAICSAAARVREAKAAGVTKEFIDRCCNAVGNPLAQADWRKAILSVVGRVAEADVTGIVTDLIEQHQLAAGDAAAAGDWLHAISSVAGRADAAQFIGLVSEFIDQYRLAAGDPDAQHLWLPVIKSATERIGPAVGLASALIEQYRSAGDSEARHAWRVTILFAAKRVSEAEAAALLRDLSGEYQLSQGDPAAQSAWRAAIKSAAGRVREADAASVVRNLIQQYRLADGESDAQDDWSAAIRAAAERVGVADAASVARSLIEHYGGVDEDSDAQDVWREAIKSVAGRVRETEAAGLVSALIEQHRLAEDDFFAQADWRETIKSVAGHVSEAEATGLVTALIEQHWLAAENTDARKDWLVAITSAAGRVAEADAAAVVRDWMKRRRSAVGNCEAQYLWRSAIRSAAGQVGEAESAALVRDLIEEHRLAHEDSTAQANWRAAIESAANRVRKTNREASVAVATCNLLLANGLSDIALQVAVNNSHVAIVWRAAREDDSPATPDVEAVLREQLVLDPTYAVAPSLVKAALAETRDAGQQNSAAGATAPQGAAGKRRGIGCLAPQDEERIKGLFGLLAEWDYKLDNQDRELINLVFSETATRIEDEKDRFLFRTYYLFVAFLQPLANLLRLEHAPTTWGDFFDELYQERKASECRLGRYAYFFGEPHLTSSADNFRRLAHRVARERFPRLFAMLEEHNRIARLGR